MKKQKQNRKKIVGLTGSFGSGKSTVAGMFSRFGALVIDADRLSRGLIKPHLKTYKKVVQFFGKEILCKNGFINRGKLAGIVFSNKKSLAKFNKIMHPAIIKQIKQKARNAKEDIVVLDAPLLLETGLDKFVDVLLVVKANLSNQLKRIQKKTLFSKLSKSEIMARIKSQSSLREKLCKADFVIDNNGTIENTGKQVALIRRLLWRR